MENLGKLCIAALGIVLAVFMSAIMLMKFWVWFIVPPFGLPILNFGQSLGAAMFLTLFRSVGPGKKEKEQKFEELLGGMILIWGLIFLLGWLIHLSIS